MQTRMRIVPFSVKPDQIQVFESTTMEHVRESLREPGIVRFEFLKQDEDPIRFVLLIAFKDDDAREHHFALEHTYTWRASVIPMLLEPIQPVLYTSVDSGG